MHPDVGQMEVFDVDNIICIYLDKALKINVSFYKCITDNFFHRAILVLSFPL